MAKPYFSGIQQIGIGVSHVHEAWKFYRIAFGMDVPIFEEAAEAGLMLPYTGGNPQQRHAILAINLNGGGGFEIWQYTSRTPLASESGFRLGDLGINMAKIKSNCIEESFERLSAICPEISKNLYSDPLGRKFFFCKDPWGNAFQIISANSWFSKGKGDTGGAYGALIGVSNMQDSLRFYKAVLGYDTIQYDIEGAFEEFSLFGTESNRYRRVSLVRTSKGMGPFSKLLGENSIELIQSLDYPVNRIFENRYWGDLGFIHLCFDIVGMDELRILCKEAGHPFTVDSSDSFDMGEAAGHFSYVEDPDGTLIEFVETHKIPILKKLGWYLDLKRRNPQKSLPTWMLKALALNRKKD
jgi:catechol 2,3-dioxygenase-like lactoylglutathione lyase family enzyme